MSINTVAISGNLTRDPELRATASGMAVLEIGVAVNENRKNPQTGEWEPYAHFFDCVAFGNRAEGLAKFLEKGMKVAICGKLSFSQWETAVGEKRSKVSILVDEVDVMSQRRDNESGGGVAASGNPPLPLVAPPSPDDEIPF